MPLKNAKFKLFGVYRCQLANTLTVGTLLSFDVAFAKSLWFLVLPVENSGDSQLVPSQLVVCQLVGVEVSVRIRVNWIG